MSMAKQLAEFPWLAEMLEKVNKVRARHRRAMATGHMRGAAKAEIDGAKLYCQLEAGKQMTWAYLDALKLIITINEAEQKRAQNSIQPLLRKSYHQDQWIESKFYRRGVTK